MNARVSPLLSITDLKVHFARGHSGWFRPPEVVKAVDGVSFDIAPGSTLAVVGESGSGKTTTALAAMRLAPITAGRVLLGDTDLGALTGEALRQARRRVQIIFQDPFSSLNPRQRAGDAVRAPLDLMQVGTPAERAMGEVALLRVADASGFQRVSPQPSVIADLAGPAALQAERRHAAMA